MRSIICISAVLAAGVATAQEFEGECWARDYSAEHLASQPEQTVEKLRITFRPWEHGGNVAEIRATMADNAYTRVHGTAGKTYSNVLFCSPHEARSGWPGWMEDGVMTCQGECDGGFFQVVSLEPGALTIRTEGVAVSDGTGCGSTLVADVTPGDGSRYVLTDYLLESAPPGVCQ
ncbi:hypothetical protein FHY55_13585 [Oceanicola sp. D3]|uniref:hypothetical protein n=1 Tax=Oceanicola sp. D3 TaxID=2587163 RepID=UPI00111F9929|nr:hypothetical protein [Oceanicola sp. D3]QDC10216.1 hypothetical protein FHY55_13585 [Oceanicola sp. D3]